MLRLCESTCELTSFDQLDKGVLERKWNMCSYFGKIDSAAHVVGTIPQSYVVGTFQIPAHLA
jgi:hypothetical protein